MLNGFLGNARSFAVGRGVRDFFSPAAADGAGGLTAEALDPALRSGGFVISEFLVAQDHRTSGTRSDSAKLVASAAGCHDQRRHSHPGGLVDVEGDTKKRDARSLINWG